MARKPKTKSYKYIAIQYAHDVASGKIIAGNNAREARRFLADLERDDIYLDSKDPDHVINIIQKTMVHRQGETIEGKPLRGEPFILLPWQVFIIYNLVGWRIKESGSRRFKEAFIFVPRKNGKTAFVAALTWGLSILERKSGSTIYIVAAALKQSKEAFEDILFSLRHKGMAKEFRIRDNNAEHSVRIDFPTVKGKSQGSIHIEALAANPDSQDSFNCNIAIADEIHAFKKPAQYNRFKEAMKAYTNKLMVGITSGGDNINSFGYNRLQYAEKVLNETVKDDSFFAFVSHAEEDEKGNVDYLDPRQHELANPSYGVTIRPEDMMEDARQAQNDPQQRKDFLSRSLNIYSSSIKTYFDLKEFRASDAGYEWTLKDLAKRKIDWYGGADLSRMHDLTAAALFGHDDETDTDIIITHGFFPIVMAAKKADEDGIPLYGWQDEGWLTMTNTPTTNVEDVVRWFCGMRRMGFKIRQIGHDRKFAREYIGAMKAEGFKVVDQPQYYYLKSEGFRHIEKAAKDGKLYYMHSQAYEYCVENVAAIERTDDMVRFEKVEDRMRIDLFDASVFACVRYLNAKDKIERAKRWFDE